MCVWEKGERKKEIQRESVCVREGKRKRGREEENEQERTESKNCKETLEFYTTR